MLHAGGPSLLQAPRAFSLPAAQGVSTAVLSWGVGQQGALGIRSDRDQHEPEEIPDLPRNIAAVGTGHYSSFAMSAEGQLFSWGRSREGQLGRPLAPDEYECSALPRQVEALNKEHVVSATGSGVASFATSCNGTLFAFGRSKRGQLGLGPGLLYAHEPLQLPLPAAALQVSAGWGHAAALLRDGSLYTWGWAAAGRLGHSFAATDQEEEEERLLERCCWEPRRVELLNNVRVRQVACGLDHTLVLAQDGSLFAFGDNSLGQLGRPSQAQGEHMRPRCVSSWIVNPEVECGRRIKFRKVAAGLAHCLGVLSDGSVVSWGWNSGGQLGLGQFVADECVPKPTPIYNIPANRHALIAAGRVHSVLATDEITDRSAAFENQGVGKAVLTMCHSWGSAANGRLGTGMCDETAFPEMLPDLDGEQILDLACGLDHTLALVKSL